jgi:hypothetical protein
MELWSEIVAARKERVLATQPNVGADWKLKYFSKEAIEASRSTADRLIDARVPFVIKDLDMCPIEGEDAFSFLRKKVRRGDFFSFFAFQTYRPS